jgi:hypothetical protein
MRNESFGMRHHFESCESEHCNMITPLGFTTGPSLNQAERKLIESDQDDENTYGRQQMLNGQYIKMRVNEVSTIFDHVSTVIHQ